MKHLAAFLETGCSYTKGAELAGVKPNRFRNRVLEELLELEERSGYSFYPRRAAYLRHRAPAIKTLLEAYDTEIKP